MSVTPEEGRAHWHGCEREHGHHACALAELARLRAWIFEAATMLDFIAQGLPPKDGHIRRLLARGEAVPLDNSTGAARMILTDEQVQKIVNNVWFNYGASNYDATHRAVARATERAVLERLREPTSAMLEAAGPMAGYDCDRKTADADHSDWWRAMIDAAAKGDA